MASEQKVKYADMEKAFSMWKGNKGLPDKVEDEWFTNQEFAKQNEISRSNSNVRLSSLLAKGILQTKRFRVLSKNGNLKNIQHYRLCKPTKKTR